MFGLPFLFLEPIAGSLKLGTHVKEGQRREPAFEHTAKAALVDEVAVAAYVVAVVDVGEAQAKDQAPIVVFCPVSDFDVKAMVEGQVGRIKVPIG